MSCSFFSRNNAASPLNDPVSCLVIGYYIMDGHCDWLLSKAQEEYVECKLECVSGSMCLHVGCVDSDISSAVCTAETASDVLCVRNTQNKYIREREWGKADNNYT